MSENDDKHNSESNKTQDLLADIHAKINDYGERRNKMEDQLLRTIKYTGETNATVMKVMASTQDMQKSQQRIDRMKLVIWMVPVFIMVFYLGFQTYQEKQQFVSEDGYVAQVKISGMIKDGSATASADTVIPALRAAFEDKQAKGVLIVISSPGGSPAQSHLIYQEIKRLREKYPDKKMRLIGTDMMTSGAMWIASASDHIAALPNTTVGSIGVIVSQLNFGKAIKNFDVERVIITSGKSKSSLDSFMPPKQEDIEKYRNIASQIHEQFIEVIKGSRGNKLKAEDDYLFTGEFWLGDKALELGLIDEVTNTTQLLLDNFQTVNVRDYSKQPGFLDRVPFLSKGSDSFSMQVLEHMTHQPPVQFE